MQKNDYRDIYRQFLEALISKEGAENELDLWDQEKGSEDAVKVEKVYESLCLDFSLERLEFIDLCKDFWKDMLWHGILFDCV